MATPRVLGQELRLTANLCLARDASGFQSAKVLLPHPSHVKTVFNALSNGLSVRPPPATIPIMPLELLLMTFFAPDGSFTRVLPSSGL